MPTRALRSPARAVSLVGVLALALPAGAAAAVAVPALVQAPPSASQSVSGQVLDSTGGIIIGASLTLRAPQGPFRRTATTDARGRYLFDKVPPGSYLLDAFRDGFAVSTQELTVSAGEPSSADVTLKPASFAEEVTVSFTGEHAQTALKSDAPVRDIPLTVKSYTSSFIKALDTKQVSDLYTYMNGVNRAGDTAYDFTMRGFESSDPGSIQYNGLPGLAARQNSPNVANIERIEILKGPASVLYGQIEPGGLVNLITKRPQMQRQHVFDLRTGTFFGTGPGFGDKNSYRLSTDLTGPIGNSTKFLYRLTASYDKDRSFRDFVDNDDTYIVPSLTWNISSGTILTVEAEYRKVNNTYDNYLIAPQNDINFVAPITVRYQEPDDSQNEKGWSANVYFIKLFPGGASWNLNWRSLIHDDERIAFENNRVESDNIRVRRRDRDQANHRQYHFLDTNVRKRFSTGSVDHSLLLGLNGGFEQSDFDRLRFGDVGFFVNLYDPVYGAQRPAIPNPGTHRVTDYRRYGAYLQDQIGFSPRWKGLASVRYDLEDQNIKELRTGTPPSQNTVGAAVPTVGLVFEPDERWSIYGSYAQSFSPPAASAVDVNGVNNFKPERAAQFEGGFKATLANGAVDATLALFHIRKENVLVAVGGGASQQIGQERSRGVEVELRLKPVSNWQTILGYTYIDGVVTDDLDPNLVGALLRNSPKHGFNLWSRYDVTSGPVRGLGLGVGLIYRGDRVGSFPGQVVLGNPIPGEPFPQAVLQLPHYFRADAGVYFVKNRYEVTLRVNNIADEV
jgi:iron complex outermembrane recepter protein